MLVDLSSGNTYVFQFEEFLDGIKDLQNNAPFDLYIDRWKHLFFVLETSVEKEYLSFLKKYKLKVSAKGRYEYYQYSYHFLNMSTPFIFHFDIENIKSKTRCTLKSLFIKTLQDYFFTANICKLTILLQNVVLISIVFAKRIKPM